MRAINGSVEGTSPQQPRTHTAFHDAQGTVHDGPAHLRRLTRGRTRVAAPATAERGSDGTRVLEFSGRTPEATAAAIATRMARRSLSLVLAGLWEIQVPRAAWGHAHAPPPRLRRQTTCRHQ